MIGYLDSRGKPLQKGGVTYTMSHSATGEGTSPENFRGYFNISVTGTWTGTVKLQVSSDNGSTWRDVTDGSWTANVETTCFEPAEDQLFRSHFTRSSGTAVVSLYQ